jgi:hypothetical protein
MQARKRIRFRVRKYRLTPARKNSRIPVREVFRKYSPV